jgi:hypothetical protein
MTGFKSKKAAALDEEGFYTVHPKDEDDDIQVYQRPWVGLTDDEREAIANSTIRIHGQEWAYATAIEAKLKELNQ